MANFRPKAPPKIADHVPFEPERCVGKTQTVGQIEAFL